MIQIAVFGDIHANLPALETVLADMDERGINSRYCLGDLVGYGTSPNEVIDLIRAENYPTLMGIYDLGVDTSSDHCGCAYKDKVAEGLGQRSIAWTNEHANEENKTFLRSLPSQIPVPLGDLRVLLVHGSPRMVNDYPYKENPESSLERVLDLTNVNVLICGHIHIPYHRILPSSRHVINAGNLGKPNDGDSRACYVILEAEVTDLKVQFLRVLYDVELATRAIESSEMPHEYAKMLRQGTG